ncbi:hypothetical protein TNCV_3385901 [Trichonephila clavipes]|uniref:Uncharacterized protein n=1 Tax=Trichonephila clavipes TaxID=2585209 RepID=A0A8X6VQY8_TRICX|nr:hypothetical protein TNCV_3385901 [Trichonephila clavipes]
MCPLRSLAKNRFISPTACPNQRRISTVSFIPLIYEGLPSRVTDILFDKGNISEKGVLPQTCGGTEPNHAVTFMVLKVTVKDRRKSSPLLR